MTKTRDERIGNKRIVELVLTEKEEEIAAAQEHKDFHSKLLKRRQEHGNQLSSSIEEMYRAE